LFAGSQQLEIDSYWKILFVWRKANKAFCGNDDQPVSCQNIHEGRLPCPTWAHDGSQLSRHKLARDAFENSFIAYNHKQNFPNTELTIL